MSEQDNSTRSGPGVGWYAAAALVVFVVASLVYILARGGDEPSATTEPSSTASLRAPSASTSSTAPAPPPTAAPAEDGWAVQGCNGTPGSGDNTAEALAAVSWEPFLASALPTSPDLGPAAVEDPVRRCFKHSPAGAVVAAATIVLTTHTPGVGERVLERQVVAGPGREEWASALAAEPTSAPATIAAYRVNACSPAACNIALIAFGQGLYAESVLPMVWVDGDWKVDGSRLLPAGGIVQGIPTGFTPWGAQP